MIRSFTNLIIARLKDSSSIITIHKIISDLEPSQFNEIYKKIARMNGNKIIKKQFEIEKEYRKRSNEYPIS